MRTDDWNTLLETERMVQDHFPEAVLVGGTAAALHAGHRISLDVDSVLVDLRTHFPAVLETLEGLAGWQTRRVRPPVLILGNFYGIDVGIRQLIRSAPLETTVVQGITIPTVDEMLRIKGWLVVTRNAVRDYLDFCALAEQLDLGFKRAMQTLDPLYPQPEGADTTTLQLAKQLAEPRPYDFNPDDDSLTVWRELKAPWTDWTFVTARSRHWSAQLMDMILR